MGTMFSFLGFQRRLKRLEEMADVNGDGIVTRRELEEYTVAKLNEKESEIEMLRARNVYLTEKIIRMKSKHKEEVSKWKRAYETSYLNTQKLIDERASTRDINSTTPVNSTISSQSIDKFVDELIADPNINIYLIPDTVEKTIYSNTLKMVFSLLQKTFNNVSVDIIGHEFKLKMQPTDTSSNSVEDQRSDQ